MPDQTIRCKNCDYPLEEAHKYCPECGQNAKDEKLEAVGYKEGTAKWKKKMYTQMLKIY